MIGQDENIELARTEVVSVDSIGSNQFVGQGIFKRDESIEIHHARCLELNNELILHPFHIVARRTGRTIDFAIESRLYRRQSGQNPLKTYRGG